MSLKAVELQVALPRTLDLGKLQEQQNEKGRIEQHSLAVSQKMHENIERTRAPESSKASNLSNRKEPDRKDQHKKREDKRRNDVMREAKHPFKGNHVDLFL